MKRSFFTLVLSFIAVALFAQVQNPVQWIYTAEKKSATSYQITITATLPKPWHIYSQTTPSGGPIPTKITFNKNPLTTIPGIPLEVGSLKVEHDKNFGVDVKYFDNKVQFVEMVNLKTPVKTTVSGAIEYMVCNDSQCLPPTTVKFQLTLQ